MATVEEMTVARAEPAARGKDPMGSAISQGSTGLGIATSALGLATMGPLGLLLGLIPKMGGILAKRAREGMLEAAAGDADVAYDLNKEIADSLERASQLPDLSRVDQEQLQAIESQRRKWSALSQHSNPAVRARATQELADLSTAPWLEDVEGRADTVEDATRQARSEYGKAAVTEFKKFRDKTDQVRSEGNAILNMVNELGSKNPSVQSRFQAFVGRARQDEDLGLSFGGIGVDAGSRIASGDEIVKAVTAIMAGTTDISTKRAGAIVEDLQKRGYKINASEDGSLTLDAEETPVTRVRSDKVEAGQESSTVGTIKRSIGKVVAPIAATAEDLLEQATGGPMSLLGKGDFHQQQKAKRRATN